MLWVHQQNRPDEPIPLEAKMVRYALMLESSPSSNQRMNLAARELIRAFSLSQVLFDQQFVPAVREMVEALAAYDAD